MCSSCRLGCGFHFSQFLFTCEGLPIWLLARSLGRQYRIAYRSLSLLSETAFGRRCLVSSIIRSFVRSRLVRRVLSHSCQKSHSQFLKPAFAGVKRPTVRQQAARPGRVEDVVAYASTPEHLCLVSIFSTAGCGAILASTPHLAPRTSSFTAAGDASASDSRASPCSAGVGAIAATASTAAAKRSIRPPVEQPGKPGRGPYAPLPVVSVTGRDQVIRGNRGTEISAEVLVVVRKVAQRGQGRLRSPRQHAY